MRDHQTQSIWSHYTGEAFDGPMKGKRLEWLQLDRANAGRLATQAPDATTPVRSSLRFRPAPPMQDRAFLGNRLPPSFAPTLPPDLGDLPYHTHGLGLAVSAAHQFYPLDDLEAQKVISDRVGGVDVVVLLQDGASAAAAYSRCVDGKTLRFEPAEHEGFAALRDKSGTVWNARGVAVSGPHAGKQLTPVRSIVTDWYGWVAYFQDTGVYGQKKSAK